MSVMHKFTCAGCGREAGSSSADHGTLCFSCSEDARYADRPLCTTCGLHKVTAKQSAVDAGESRCRSCYQMDFEAEMQNEYAPVLEIVKDFTGFDGYVENTGGNCMVAKVYLPADTEHGWCCICTTEISNTPAGWVHVETQVAACAEGQGSYLDEGTPIVATPQEGYPQVAITYDTDEVWFISLQRHWEDEDAYQGIDCGDLPSGGHGVPIYGGDAVDAEDVAARVLLLIDNPQYGRLEPYGPRLTHYTNYTLDVHVEPTWLAEKVSAARGDLTGPLHPSIYAVTNNSSAELFRSDPDTWKIASFGPREVLGDGWFRLSVGASVRADWPLPTVEQVIAHVSSKCPHFTVVRKV